MPVDKPLSRELRICLAIWRKAYHERDTGEPVTINCRNRNSAIAIRQSMYRAIQPFRHGRMFDEELRLAAELFVCAIDESGGATRLVLKPRVTLSELDINLEELGLSESDLLLNEEKMVGQSLGEFLDEAPEKTTPFYTRD